MVDHVTTYLTRNDILTLVFGRFLGIDGRGTRFFLRQQLKGCSTFIGVDICTTGRPQVSRNATTCRGHITVHGLYRFNNENFVGRVTISSGKGQGHLLGTTSGVVVRHTTMRLRTNTPIGNGYHYTILLYGLHRFGNICKVVVPTLTGFGHSKGVGNVTSNTRSFTHGTEVFRGTYSTTIVYSLKYKTSRVCVSCVKFVFRTFGHNRDRGNEIVTRGLHTHGTLFFTRNGRDNTFFVTRKGALYASRFHCHMDHTGKNTRLTRDTVHRTHRENGGHPSQGFGVFGFRVRASTGDVSRCLFLRGGRGLGLL